MTGLVQKLTQHLDEDASIEEILEATKDLPPYDTEAVICPKCRKGKKCICI